MGSVMICCVGSRGDVQPFLSLGAALKHHGYTVVVGTHPEFERLVLNEGLMFGLISQSLSEAGRKHVKDLQQIRFSNSVRKLRDFFGPLFIAWFDDIVHLCMVHKPDLLVLTTWPLYCGGLAIPAMLDKSVVCMVMHTIPAQATADFAPSTAGAGFTRPFGWMNLLLWRLSSSILTAVYLPLIQTNLQRHRLKVDNTSSLFQPKHLEAAGVQTLYIYSRLLLPKPQDWGPSAHVVGPLLNHRQVPTALPADLEAFVSVAQELAAPVIYVGFGSMLEVMFSDEEASALLEQVAHSVALLQQHMPCRAIIHAVTGQHSQPRLQPARPGAAHMWLRSPVTHAALLPRCDLVVHHGGAGTTAAALAAGRPALVLPASPASDQPFWADILQRKGLGPKGFKLHGLSPHKLAAALREGLQQLPRYTSNVAAFNRASAAIKEDGVADCVSLITKALAVGEIDRRARADGRGQPGYCVA